MLLIAEGIRLTTGRRKFGADRVSGDRAGKRSANTRAAFGGARGAHPHPTRFPTTVGPDPDTIACSAPPAHAPRRAHPRSTGSSDTAAGCRSLTTDSSGNRPPGVNGIRSVHVAGRPAPRPSACSPSRSASADRRPASTARTPTAQPRTRARRAARSARPTPPPRSRRHPGQQLARDVGPQRGGDRVNLLGPAGRDRHRQPQRGGRVGRPAGHPGGDRDPLLDRDTHRRTVPTAGAQRSQRPRGQVLALTPGQTTRSGTASPSRASSSTHVGQRQRLEHCHELVPAVLPRRHPGTARGLPSPAPAPAIFTRRSSPPARRTAAASAAQRGRPRATPSPQAPRARSSRTPGCAPGDSASDPASALRRWRKASWTSLTTVCGGPLATTTDQAQQDGIDVGNRTEHLAADTGRSTFTSHSS